MEKPPKIIDYNLFELMLGEPENMIDKVNYRAVEQCFMLDSKEV